jgi:hypothetical protein
MLAPATPCSRYWVYWVFRISIAEDGAPTTAAADVAPTTATGTSNASAIHPDSNRFQVCCITNRMTRPSRGPDGPT